MTAPTRSAAVPHAHKILGTAGHIDHGKTSLVRALTGIDPDRLPEEQARGMTIDLGFAHLDLEGVRLSLVDVPGHEKFVRNMVAGATGIDMALLVVAADDGVMPQTREHIDILRLLGIDTGLLVLTKIDLVPAERVADVERTLRAELGPTGLGAAVAIPVSNHTRAGLAELRAALTQLVTESAARPARRRSDVFRLPIDRSFTVAGRGTVVTGSLLSGQLASGAEVELLPAARRLRVRGLHSHHTEVGGAAAGQRTAVNLASVGHAELVRGDELATPGCLTPSRLWDVSLSVLPGVTRPLASRSRLRVIAGTREQMATVVLPAGADGKPGSLPPGAEGLAQLRFAEPMVAEWGQRFIVRDETAVRTVGGGAVLRPVGRARWRGSPEELSALRTLAVGSPRDRLAQVFRDAEDEPPTERQAAIRAGLRLDQIADLLSELGKLGQLVTLGPPGSRDRVAAETLSAAAEVVLGYVGHFHREHPEKLGIARKELLAAMEPRLRRALAEAAVARLLREARLVGRDDAMYVAGRTPPLSEADRRLLEGLEAAILAGRFAPQDPAATPVAAGADPRKLKAMLDLGVASGRLAFVATGIYLHADVVAELKSLVAAAAARGPLAVKDIRDLTGSSRKYIVPICEFLDRIGFTQRQGDNRVLRR